MMTPHLPRRTSSVVDERVVLALAAVGAGRHPAGRPEFDAAVRAELRAQLVAVAPRLIEEGPLPHEGPRAQPTSTPARPAVAAPVRASRRRPLTAGFGVLGLLAAGLVGATYLSRSALPGDALYGLKRTSEDVGLTFSGSDTDKGHGYLDQAQTRVEEAATLLDHPSAMAAPLGGRTYQAGAALTSARREQISGALHSADTETRAGIRMLSAVAVHDHDAAPLAIMLSWAPGQQQRIDDLVRRLPAGPVRDAAVTSAGQLRAADTRAQTLKVQLAAGTACSNRGQDDLGPVPCVGSSPAGTGGPGGSSGPSGSVPGSGLPSNGLPGSGLSGGSQPGGGGSGGSQPGGGGAVGPTAGSSAPGGGQPGGSQPGPSTAAQPSPTAGAPLPLPTSIVPTSAAPPLPSPSLGLPTGSGAPLSTCAGLGVGGLGASVCP